MGFYVNSPQHLLRKAHLSTTSCTGPAEGLVDAAFKSFMKLRVFSTLEGLA
jgi:hypothetical protein